MQRQLDRSDALVASCLATSIFIWAFVWAHPYPHPDIWPFLGFIRGWIGLGAIGIAGRIALGVFAAFVYLVLRVFLVRRRRSSRDDEILDGILFTRLPPLCGAAIFALAPFSWRAGQFLSPGFALLTLTAFAGFLWLHGRGGRSCHVYSLAYLVFGFVCGLSPLGFAALVPVAVSDVVLRWRDGLVHNQRETDDEGRRKKSLETWLSFFSSAIGFALALWLLSSFVAEKGAAFNLLSRLGQWASIWLGGAERALRSDDLLPLALSIIIAASGIAIGRRIRLLGPNGRITGRVFGGFLIVFVLVFLMRSVDRAERIRLQTIGEYVGLVAEDVREAEFLFTDDRLADPLKFEFTSRGIGTVVLNAMSVPSAEEGVRLRMLAPAPEDRAIFEAGGAEIFRAWARERPDRLVRSAWQIGNGVLRRYGKVIPRTHGSVIRNADEARISEDKAADARFAAWSARLSRIARDPQSGGSLLGDVDNAVAGAFDALLWRAARLAGERAEQAAQSGDTASAEEERMMMRTLDEANASLQRQGEMVERMMPTEKLVLTSREALDVALKRADFSLAKRYAGEILADSPDDPAANFALGMAHLEAEDYFRAALAFEKALVKNPREPAALNNLAIAYFRQGEREKALACAERAAAFYPDSEPIRRTLEEIRRK